MTALEKSDIIIVLIASTMLGKSRASKAQRKMLHIAYKAKAKLAEPKKKWPSGGLATHTVVFDEAAHIVGREHIIPKSK
jgi:hypothetical protein